MHAMRYNAVSQVSRNHRGARKSVTVTDRTGQDRTGEPSAAPAGKTAQKASRVGTVCIVFVFNYGPIEVKLIKLREEKPPARVRTFH